MKIFLKKKKLKELKTEELNKNHLLDKKQTRMINGGTSLSIIPIEDTSKPNPMLFSIIK